jgi:V8-like Glu-specific endopeptidase
MERTNHQKLNYQSDILEKIYDSNVTYKRGEFNVQKSEGEDSSAPVRPKSPIPQKALIVSSGKFTKECLLISGADRREKIQDTSYPYSIHTQIESVFKDGLYGGTGSMVGPHHLLTCGHNIYSKGKWAQGITVYPGRQGKMATYGKASVTRAYLLKSWTEKEKKESDIALLVLNQSVGLLTGWGGIVSSSDSSLRGRTFHITGYPGDKKFVEMWSSSNKIGKVFDETFGYNIDTMGGQSGSAIWSKDFGNPMIVGVHTSAGESVNCGVRISNNKFKEFLEPMISQTYEMIENLPLSADCKVKKTSSNVIALNSQSGSRKKLEDIANGVGSDTGWTIETMYNTAKSYCQNNNIKSDIFIISSKENNSGWIWSSSSRVTFEYDGKDYRVYCGNSSPAWVKFGIHGSFSWKGNGTSDNNYKKNGMSIFVDVDRDNQSLATLKEKEMVAFADGCNCSGDRFWTKETVFNKVKDYCNAANISGSFLIIEKKATTSGWSFSDGMTSIKEYNCEDYRIYCGLIPGWIKFDINSRFSWQGLGVKANTNYLSGGTPYVINFTS